MRFLENSKFLIGTFILGLFLFVAYLSVTDATFIIDDKGFYIEDPIMTKPDGLWRIWLNPLETNGIWSYVPISRTTFWLERQIWGLNYSVTHWINVIFHLINAFLLWRILLYLQIRGAWLVGMCFALHPIHVQTVAWIAERRNVVAGVFFFLALWGYLHFEKEHKTRWYFITLGLFLCALLSKTSTIMLPPIFILCRLWLHLRWSLWDIGRLLPFFVLAFGMGYARIWFEFYSFGAGTLEQSRSFLEKLLTAGHVPFFYLSKIVFPYLLVFIYPKWNMDTSQVAFYLPLCSLIVITGLLFWKYQSWNRVVFIGLGIYGVLVFPVMGFFYIAWHKFSFVSDHWAYLPSVPLLILLVEGIYRVFEKSSILKNQFFRPVFVFWMVLFVLLTVRTQSRATIYKNPKTLWLATASDHPNSWEAHADLGKIYFEEGQFDLALKHANRSVNITQEKTQASVYNTRGTTYAGLKKYEQALQDFNRTLAINPNHSLAYNNRGNVHFELGQYEQALQDFNKALTYNPKVKTATSIYTNPGQIYYNRGRVYFKLKQYERALEDYNQALTFKHNVADTHYRRGEVFFKFKKYQQALQDYNQTLRLNPNHVSAYFNRGTTYFTLKKYEKALDDFNKVLALHPQNVDSFNARGLIYIKQKKYDKAYQDFTQAIALNPQQTASYQNRGNLHLLLKQYSLALEDLNQAIQLAPKQAKLYNQRGTLHLVIFQNQEAACTDWKQACAEGECKNFLTAQQKGDCSDF